MKRILFAVGLLLAVVALLAGCGEDGSTGIPEIDSSPWGHKRAGHDLATKQQEYPRNFVCSTGSLHTPHLY